MPKLKPFLLSVLTGLLLALGWPATGGFSPFLFLGLIPLLWMHELKTIEKNGSIFGYALIAFALFNLLTTWWIYCVTESLTTKIFVLLAAIMVNSILMAMVLQLFHFTRKTLGLKKGLIALVVYWLGFEYLHLDWDLSWPWLTLGNGFASHPTWVQWYEYTGSLGGSLWIWITNIFGFLLVKNAVERTKPLAYLSYRIPLWLLIVGGPILFSYTTYNQYAIKNNPVNIVIVQPNIDPYQEKYDLSPDEQLQKMLALAQPLVDTSTHYILGPETAITEDVWENEPENALSIIALRNFLANYPNTHFVSGISTYYLFDPDEKRSNTARPLYNNQGYYDAYNSAIQLDNSTHLQLYHKSKLVQGVEMIPFASIMKPLQKLTIELGGTIGGLGSQPEPETFRSVDGTTQIAPVICYESIYGEYVVNYIRKGAGLIFIMTNDGWWKDTPGYQQHLAYARLRAIETRRSIARSANTGVSAFINQKGDIIKKTDWWEPAALSGQLDINEDLTFYVMYGDYLGRLASFLGIGMLLYTLVTSLKRKNSGIS